MITSYFHFQDLPDQTRVFHKIRSKQRIDCTRYHNSGGYIGLSKFKNAKGHLCLYRGKARDVVKATSSRIADIGLSNGDWLSSIYIEDLDNKQFGYGDFGNDGLLFIINDDYTSIELLVIPNGKNLITGYYQKLIDGDYDEVLSMYRSDALPYFEY